MALSCGQKDNTSSNNESIAVSNEIEVPPVIPKEILINLFENCNYIDFIFATLPFSISQDQKSSIQQTISHIDQKRPLKIDNSCPYFAQQIFQVDGKIVLDAKIFFQENCTYYLFYENGELKYSAGFTQAGITFYNNIIAQAKEVSNNE